MQTYNANLFRAGVPYAVYYSFFRLAKLSSIGMVQRSTELLQANLCCVLSWMLSVLFLSASCIPSWRRNQWWMALILRKSGVYLDLANLNWAEGNGPRIVHVPLIAEAKRAKANLRKQGFAERACYDERCMAGGAAKVRRGATLHNPLPFPASCNLSCLFLFLLSGAWCQYI